MASKKHIPLIIQQQSLPKPEQIGMFYSDELSDVKNIDEGNFGIIYKATYKKGGIEDPKTVVIKLPKEDITYIQIEKEVRINAGLKIKHENILPILGVCFNFKLSGIHINKQCIVTPYCEKGNLKHLLEEEKKQLSLNPNSIAPQDLICSQRSIYSIGSQVANGLAHLHSNHIIHRDIAARNVLITEQITDQGKIVKAMISDFGLSRLLDYNSEYISNNKTIKLPIRYISPESLETYKFTQASDVWAFGVFLWELMTGGSQPYSEIQDNRFIFEKVREGKLKLIPPILNPPQPKFIDIFNKCMEYNPKERPTMSEVYHQLENLMYAYDAKQSLNQELKNQNKNKSSPNEYYTLPLEPEYDNLPNTETKSSSSSFDNITPISYVPTESEKLESKSLPSSNDNYPPISYVPTESEKSKDNKSEKERIEKERFEKESIIKDSIEKKITKLLSQYKYIDGEDYKLIRKAKFLSILNQKISNSLKDEERLIYLEMYSHVDVQDYKEKLLEIFIDNQDDFQLNDQIKIDLKNSNPEFTKFFSITHFRDSQTLKDLIEKAIQSFNDVHTLKAEDLDNSKYDWNKGHYKKRSNAFSFLPSFTSYREKDVILMSIFNKEIYFAGIYDSNIKYFKTGKMTSADTLDECGINFLKSISPKTNNIDFIVNFSKLNLKDKPYIIFFIIEIQNYQPPKNDPILLNYLGLTWISSGIIFNANSIYSVYKCDDSFLNFVKVLFDIGCIILRDKRLILNPDPLPHYPIIYNITVVNNKTKIFSYDEKQNQKQNK